MSGMLVDCNGVSLLVFSSNKLLLMEGVTFSTENPLGLEVFLDEISDEVFLDEVSTEVFLDVIPMEEGFLEDTD